MSTRTVRLDTEAEKALEEIREATGLSISEALKRGLNALQQEINGRRGAGAWTIYRGLDLGVGGYAGAPSDAGREAIRDVIIRRTRGNT